MGRWAGWWLETVKKQIGSCVDEMCRPQHGVMALSHAPDCVPMHTDMLWW